MKGIRYIRMYLPKVYENTTVSVCCCCFFVLRLRYPTSFQNDTLSLKSLLIKTKQIYPSVQHPGLKKTYTNKLPPLPSLSHFILFFFFNFLFKILISKFYFIITSITNFCTTIKFYIVDEKRFINLIVFKRLYP